MVTRLWRVTEVLPYTGLHFNNLSDLDEFKQSRLPLEVTIAKGLWFVARKWISESPRPRG